MRCKLLWTLYLPGLPQAFQEERQAVKGLAGCDCVNTSQDAVCTFTLISCFRYDRKRVENDLRLF